ncbi:MAG: CoA transferase, partial [Rhodobacteraceae bacterium]|nr:CoA transferase [Paracoccaceae bacterium]
MDDHQTDQAKPEGMIPVEFSPLRGKRVVEVSHMIFGPSTGYFLAALGAEVIKVEPPDGDKTRRLTGMGAAFFPAFNRGKKSIRLDMGTTEGRKAFSALLASADILVENFRDSSLAAMGLDPAMLQEQYPHLIVVSCKGFLDGPYRNRSALDEVVQMMTGLAYMTGPPGQPLRVGASVNDIMGGLFGARSVLGVLCQRQNEHSASPPAPSFRIGLFEN